MIDLDKFMESCKPYQKIIDDVTLDECICVAMGIPIGCNHEEMIVKAIIQRLLKAEKVRADAIDECIDKFAEIMSKMYQICGRSCPVNCNWGTTTNCKDMCKKWLFEQLKEQKNG